MWPTRRLFTCLTLCCFLLGCVWVVRLRVAPPLGPGFFLPGAPRHRPDRVCAPLGLLIVNSSPRNAHRRQVIRETWGHPAITRPLGLGVAFGVGSSEDASQRPMDWEAETFGDVFQLSMVDEYRSLPQKILGLLEVAKGACTPQQPSFIVKADDDVFINVFALRDLLKDLKTSYQSHQKNLWCLVWEGMPVVRSNHSKWYLSRDEYSDSIYPTYCSGLAYVLDHGVADAILEHSNFSSSITSEDVLITGILAKDAGVGHVQLGSRYAFQTIDEEKVVSGQTIFAHLGNLGPEDRVERLWNYLLWKKREKSSGGL